MLIHDKLWFTAAELAELQLAGLPKRKREINRLAAVENWAVAVSDAGAPLARRHSGRGGGFTYHASLLPAAARADLVQKGLTGGQAAVEAGNCNDASNLWHWLGRQPESVRAEAQRRTSILACVDMFEAAGMTRSAAIAAVAEAENISTGTLWNWLRLVSGVAVSERLPLLAPRRAGGGIEAEVDPTLWQELLSDYLRLSGPSWSTCYERIAAKAKAQGIALPHSRTLWRKFKKEVPEQVATLRRKGEEALRGMLPAQIRSVAELQAMDLVNIDGHRCDVFVRMPDGRIIRPTMIAIQDVYSRKFLSWRFAETEDMVTARLVFADLFAKWGIPKGLLTDNGRAFASKWLTGGAKTRFRFKVRDEDPTGLLVALGITIHWAKPYRGQSKPIERGFRDLCDAIAKHPAFEGAYTGNRPDAKPENYGSKAVDFETFQQVWNAGMDAHNRKLGRRSEMAGGRLSFDQVFEESYARAAIGKATDEQLRMALLAADQVRTDRKTGGINLAGNRYWAPELSEIAGQLVTVRFDPEQLHAPIHVYDRAGRFLVTAPLWEATGFLDMAAAKKRQRLERNWKKSAKAATEALDLLSADELVARLPDYDGEEAVPKPGAARMVRHRGNTVAQLKAVSQAAERPLSTPQAEATIDRFARAAERHLRAID
ncbi:transposase domain-containing protein [Sphingopyxis sp. GW247-27LB]|uniref:transposase domain-containing protein n=1 Tax=Sphingopyxis sp. GW247-27LB TaxID=2012632 RepID=UPI00159512A0|nr:transposase domain-containing protein [Sphingopyxis sp. GW247-27LB]